MRYMMMGIVALLMLGGCTRQPQPQPQPQVKPKPKPLVEKKVVKPKTVKHKKLKKGEVPPLPEREVDVDMDNMVDQATAEILNDDNAA
ncbi:MAG TPA: hypothetical protein ENL02_01360 [Epsilonproteobacteria bacterium]|nr:hypothetical protein [Campylobacterota bacterium]